MTEVLKMVTDVIFYTLVMLAPVVILYISLKELGYAF